MVAIPACKPGETRIHGVAMMPFETVTRLEGDTKPRMDHHLDLDMLGQSEIFQGASLDVLREAQATSFRKRYAAGEVVFQQGDPANVLALVVAGQLRASQTTSDGQQIIIQYLGPGKIVGYTTLSGGENHPGTVTAVNDSHLIGWSGSAIREIMLRYPIVALNALAILGARYHEMQIRLRELSTEKVEQRIAHTILRLAQQAGRRTTHGVEIAFPVSRQDLAEMAGTTLHTVSRTLSGWEDQGIVDCGRRRVILCKSQALEAIARKRD